MSFHKRRALSDEKEELSHIKSKTELMFVLAAVFLLVTGLLFLLPTEKKAPPGVSVWPPGTPLRIEARRDFNLKGGPVTDGTCFVEGAKSTGSSFGGGRRSASKEAYRNRPHECSDADHDLYARYIDPDGNEFDVISHSRTENAEGAFRQTIPKVKGSSYGKKTGDGTYAADVGSGMYRVEEMTYAHRFLKPGTYHFNVHLQRADNRLPDEDVLVSVFIVLYEGTPDEIVVFNDRLVLNIENADSREQTVVTFEIDEQGQLVEDSVDLETQVVIAEQ